MGAIKLMSSCFGLPAKKKLRDESSAAAYVNVDGVGEKQGREAAPPGAVTSYYTFKELKAATGNFNADCKLDYGELGLVFKAVLSRTEVVAVKRATRESHKSHADFQKEVEFLSGLRDKHLANLCGFCEEKGEQILVYEFVANGNLADHFLGGADGLSLTWRERVQVATDTAKGLAYLHVHEDDAQVIHRDVKPSNILLDHRFHAKVANFGPFATHSLRGAMGTPGYVDPSFVKSCAGPQCDVHSFGVVLLQLVTGKSACDGLRDDAEYHITDWVRAKLGSGDLESLLDINLRSSAYNRSILLQMAHLGLRCTDLDVASRPPMSQVVQDLELALRAADADADADAEDDDHHHHHHHHSHRSSAADMSPSNAASGYTCKSSGSDFSLPELGGKDSHIKFDGMEWIDIKALEVPDFGDVFDDDDDDDDDKAKEETPNSR